MSQHSAWRPRGFGGRSTIKDEIKLDRVHFATDSAVLDGESDQVLAYAVATLNKYPQMVIEVRGHTDNRGSKQHNQGLSQRRAEAVMAYLKEHGVTNTMTAKGFGEDQPDRGQCDARGAAAEPPSDLEDSPADPRPPGNQPPRADARGGMMPSGIGETDGKSTRPFGARQGYLARPGRTLRTEAAGRDHHSHRRHAGGGLDRPRHRAGAAAMDLEPPVRNLITRLGRVLVIALFAIMALQNLGVELLPLLAGLGVAGAGIALATQGVLSNVVAGLSTIFAKPYRVGEYIAIAGVEGQVESITLFSTALTHLDRSRVIVPNRKVVGEILHNYGKIRQVETRVGVAYESDLAAVLGVIRDLVRANPRVLAEPAPVIQVMTLAEFGSANRHQALGRGSGLRSRRGRALSVAGRELRRRGVVIPYPQREVRLIPPRLIRR